MLRAGVKSMVPVKNVIAYAKHVVRLMTLMHALNVSMNIYKMALNVFHVQV